MNIIVQSDPTHGLKLVKHVCRHIDVPAVLTDALMLCDAFTHVSKLDTCVSLLQRTMVATAPARHPVSRAAQCASFLQVIYEEAGYQLAERVGERMAGFCAIMLEDYRKTTLRGETFMKETARRQAMVASSTACAMLSVMTVMRAGNINGGGSSSVAPKLLKEFEKISKLQSGCGIFLTLEELRDPSFCATVVSDLLQPSVDLLLSHISLLEVEDEDISVRDELKPLVATAKQWCAILCDTPSRLSQVWSRAIGAVASLVAEKSKNHASLLLLEVSGLLEEHNGSSSFHAIMSVALTLCARAFSEAHNISGSMSHISQDATNLTTLNSMKCIAQASQLLREDILLHSPSCLLSPSLSLANVTELICEISIRSDVGIGEQLERYIGMLQSSGRKYCQQVFSSCDKSGLLADKRLPPTPNLHPTWYIGDGLLLQPLEALFLSMSYYEMILDIESTSKPTDMGSNDAMMEKSEIMHSLESRGAHATSLRVLMHSTGLIMFQHSENILKQNNCVLAERSLGGTESGLTSGVIDELMSVSFLLHLPKEMAFKVIVNDRIRR